MKEMKRFILCLFMAVFCATNVLAAGDNSKSRVVSNRNSTENTSVSERDEDSEDVSQNRALRRINAAKSAKGENKTVLPRNVSKNKSGETSGRGTQKGVNGVVPRNVAQRNDARSVLEETVNTVGRNARTDAASVNKTAAARRAGVVLRDTTTEVGGRAKIAGTDMHTGSNINEQVRGIQGRASILGKSKKNENKVPTAESIAVAKDVLEKTADLNNTCQQQYNECMDQFCAVVDANQKRCSCSANLANYAKVQKAVEEANTELNDVAQRIRYVGLSADEIHAIMNATEAELAMTKDRDTTVSRSMLDDIAEMIKDPSSSNSSDYFSSSTSMLDMEFDFSDDSSEIFNLDMFKKNSDISSKRGKDLYKEATKRCKNVLNQCKDAGATEAQITGNYDLAIDKDCIAYEQGLDNLNKQLVSNVRSANLMLQKARLAVMQNKNEYDIRGCVGALETCMTDDMVCGENYVKCLDPTKNFIDENGKVVLGRNIANITAFVQNYNNTSINSDFIKNSLNDTTCSRGDGACIVNYLMKKIGTGRTIKDGGLCRAVLDRCQLYTYYESGKTSVYNPYNDVVINYIQRALINIKAAQSKIISNYASSCLMDVSDCYNDQLTQINALTTSASVSSIYSVMTGACYNVSLTCGYAVFAYDAGVAAEIETINNDQTLSETQKDMQQKTLLIQRLSELFYQNLLCPNNSTFQEGDNIENISPNRTIEGYVNNHCKCDAGYTVWGGACVVSCPANQYRNNLGICTSCSGTIQGSTQVELSRETLTVEPNECVIRSQNSSVIHEETSQPETNGAK